MEVSTMQLQLSREHINALTKRLDFELVGFLSERLAGHVEVELVQPHKLSPGIILAVQTDCQRIELMTAYLPITNRSVADCSISTSGIKYLCSRYELVPRNDTRWQLDQSFGENGYQSFCLATIDDDSVEATADVITEHILHHLSPLYA